jgi:hypothetical protein
MLAPGRASSEEELVSRNPRVQLSSYPPPMAEKIRLKQRPEPGELRFGCPDAHPVSTRAASAPLCYLSNHGVRASAHASANPSATRATSNDASSDQARRNLRIESTKRRSDAPSATRWFRYRRKKRSLCCAIGCTGGEARGVAPVRRSGSISPRRCPPPRVVYEDRLYNAGADAIIALVKGTAPTVRTLFEIARRARKPAAYFFSATRCQEGGENNVKASED